MKTWKVFACVGENLPNYWIVSTRAFKGTVLCQTHSEEYARRVAACVNACEGISTEEVAGWAGFDGLNPAQLRKQRDDLLDLVALALPYVEEAENDQGYKPGVVSKLVRRIRAAVEG